MGANSKIEWTNHTFNPWRGCSKVSPGCANCYAEQNSKRNPSLFGIWGNDGTRVIAADSYWKQPLAWDKAAAKAKERHRIFCASIADIFEDRPELEGPRSRLFELIKKTPHLDWLLLTKRPENISRLSGMISFPENIWLGTSVENQDTANERIPALLAINAIVRFLSCEPLLGAVSLPATCRIMPGSCWCGAHISYPMSADFSPSERKPSPIHWVIVGGESGKKARIMHPDWARSLRDQCQTLNIPFFFKQWGEWRPVQSVEESVTSCHKGTFRWVDENGDAGWTLGCEGRAAMIRAGKASAGRELDGREWNEFPKVK